MSRELWRLIRHPYGLRVIHGLPKGLSQQEPPSMAEARERQREWLRSKGITEMKALHKVLE